MILTKTWRLVAKENKEIIISGEFGIDSKTESNQYYAFDFDTEQEMNNKIDELGLINV